MTSTTGMSGRNNRGVRFGTTNDGSDQVDENQNESQSTMGVIMERNIVERKVTSSSPFAPQGGRTKKRQSHFAQQQQLAGKGITPAAGSPSLNMPLGAFVKKKNNAASHTKSSPITDKLPNKTATKSNQSTTPSDEADAMLSKMSASERLEMAEELRAALPPEAVAFLKKRYAQKSKAASSLSDKNAVQVAPTTTSTEISEEKQQPTSTERHSSEMDRKSDENSQPEKQEKQRMAQILSNVKTYEDLDAAYKAEVGDFSPLSSELGNDVVKEAQKDPFQLACILLRSTVPRQNLWAAKVVTNRLQTQWETGDLCSIIASAGTGDVTKSPPWPYPVLLPASLRCLLDSSVLHTGYVLHTYVLQAMYNLLRLRSCIEHVTDVDITNESSEVHATSIYQKCFLEDSVPTPPIGSTYQSTSSVVEAIAPGNDASTTAAYKTSSSSKSARSDGEAFGNDPSWTLLSRMCIIPRLAQLLATAKNEQQQIMPKEALSAICGILAIIGQRSPGAATAIVHHSTMLHDLLELTLKPRDRAMVENTAVESPYECFVALPAMRLLCALARQSRVVAEKIQIFFVDNVPTLLAIKPRSKQEHQLQKWSLILWRTLLRYGLGLAQLPTMITISAPHMVVRQTSMVAFSLSNEFSSSFANVLFCLRVARLRANKAQDGEDGDDLMMSTDEMDSVLAADHWLSSSAQQAVGSFEALSSASCLEGGGTSEPLRFWAGQLQFLSAFLETSRVEARLSGPSAVETWISSCQQILFSLVRGGFLKKTISDLRSVAYVFSFAELPGLGKAEVGSKSLVEEASACAFLCAFVSLQLSLLKMVLSSTGDTCDAEDARATARESIKFVVVEFASLLQTSISTITKNNSDAVLSGGFSTAPTARRGWLNRACFASIQILIAAGEYQMLPSAEYNNLLRRLQFSLLGRLERGDEAMAAVLFSQDSSFDVDRPQEAAGQDDGSFSVISSVFLRELCRTSSARLQLEHSFSLRHGPGLAREELGSSKLRSLLSDVDAVVPSRDMDPLLPMGPLWLWLMLSGTIEEGQSEGIKVLSSALRLILELEQSATSDGNNCFNYAAQVSCGAKMYHLLTICLHSETIMQNDQVVVPAELLLDLYSQDMSMSGSDSFSLEFARACVLHSSSKKKKTEKDSNSDAPSKEEKLVAQLLNGPDTERRGSLSEEEIRAMLEFLGELCETYQEYGAQYDFFTKCVRCLLQPAFPSRIRCQAMRRLGDVLSLISLPGEDENQSQLVSTLQRSIAGSLPHYDGSTRESPEFLDALVAVYSKGSNPRIHVGYILLLFVLVHARHLAICLQPGWVGLEAELKRLKKVHADVVSIVVDATNRFLKCPDQSKAMLVQAAVDAVVSREGRINITS